MPESDVMLGWVHPGRVHYRFMNSVLHSLVFDKALGANRLAGWDSIQSGANVAAARNLLCERFLDSPGTWLMMLDTDMTWEPESIQRLLDVAEANEAFVVGGLCFSEGDTDGESWPTLYDIRGTEDDPQFIRYHNWPINQLFPVLATGAAFILIHRKVLEAVRDRAGARPYVWFQETALKGLRIGEDVTFCMRAQAAEFQVYVDTSVHIGHCKEKVLTVDGYLSQRAEKAAVAEMDGSRKAMLAGIEASA